MRALTFCLLGFASFLKFEVLFIESSKTDQFWEGAVIAIAIVAFALEQYMSMGSIAADQTDSCLFMGIIHIKKGADSETKLV